jgi:hypothetical protein
MLSRDMRDVALDFDTKLHIVAVSATEEAHAFDLVLREDLYRARANQSQPPNA